MCSRRRSPSPGSVCRSHLRLLPHDHGDGLVRGPGSGASGDAAVPHLSDLLARLPQVLRRHAGRDEQGHRRDQPEQVPGASAEDGQEGHNSLPDANSDGQSLKKTARKECKTQIETLNVEIKLMKCFLSGERYPKNSSEAIQTPGSGSSKSCLFETD